MSLQLKHITELQQLCSLPSCKLALAVACQSCRSFCYFSMSARKTSKEKEELYSFASTVVLSTLTIDSVLGTMNAAEIHVSICFPYQSIFLGWKCQLAENSLHPLDFPWQNGRWCHFYHQWNLRTFTCGTYLACWYIPVIFPTPLLCLSA